MAFIWALTRPYSLKTRFYLFSGSPIFKGLEKYTRRVEKIGTQNLYVLWTLKGYKRKKSRKWNFQLWNTFLNSFRLNLDNRTYTARHIIIPLYNSVISQILWFRPNSYYQYKQVSPIHEMPYICFCQLIRSFWINCKLDNFRCATLLSCIHFFSFWAKFSLPIYYFGLFIR